MKSTGQENHYYCIRNILHEKISNILIWESTVCISRAKEFLTNTEEFLGFDC